MNDALKAPAGRRRLMLGVMLASVVFVLGRAIQIQVIEGGKWEVRAQDQHGDTLTLLPARGMIYDRNGIPLAGTHEVFQVSIAPNEVTDPARIGKVLHDIGSVDAADIRRALDKDRKWVVMHGRFDSRVDGALRNVPGVYVTGTSQRFYPHGSLALEVLGAVSEDGHPAGGVELEMDSVLRGSAGQATVRRDSRGRVLPGAMMRTVQPVPGRDVYLTIDAGLQEIAEAALGQAMDSTQSAGGELLLADPKTGEILAAVSRRGSGRAGNWRAVMESYEPGSTIKPFTVAALLENKRATMQDSVYGEQGEYELNGRKLRDEHPSGWITVGDAVRISSNIAIAKVATRLDPQEQYLNLRNFGFGSPSGVEYPSETSGRLPRPRLWSKQSAASLAIGYELGVTPLQMAMAYGAIANGGELLEPRLVREIRARDGSLESAFEPHIIRRAVSQSVALQLRGVLSDVVSDGTGKEAALGTYTVAGKTGTARVAENGRYKEHAYTATFAGFFPAEDPQLVFLVKLDEPKGEYYAAGTAAPVIRVALEAALAALNTPLDRSVMATRAPELPNGGMVRLASTMTFAPHARVEASRGPSIVKLSARVSNKADTTELLVPETTGLALRDAARSLHAAGFRVSVTGTGNVQSTYPQSGAAMRRGQVVRIVGGGAQ